MKIHPLADVQSTNIGSGTTIWQFSVVLKDAVIGNDCNINCHTFIENDVVLGNNVTVKSGIYIWDGISVEDDVFLGPNVVFTNDLRPRSKLRKPFAKTLIRKGASIGANATVLAGVTIGRYAMAGIGAVITRDVPDHALVYGSPARVKGWVDEYGDKMMEISKDIFESRDGIQFRLTEKGLSKI